MLTLTEFLLARIAEDETLARHVWPERFTDRMLAECEAKRRIVELHNVGDHTCQGPEHATWTPDCHTLRALAAIHADHPDYDESWKP